MAPLARLTSRWNQKQSKKRCESPHRRVHRPYGPSLEPLEDRLTPAGLDFFPVAHVSMNPGPMPPSGGTAIMFPGVYVEEVPLVGTPIPGVSSEQETLTGVLSKQVLLQTDPSAIPSLWSLEVFYTEKVSITNENFVPPTAFNAGSFSDNFSMTGTAAAVLVSANPLQPQFRMHLGRTETGSVTLTQSPTAPQENATLAWTALITESGMETPLQPACSSALACSPQSMSLSFQANIQSAGTEVLIAFEQGAPDQPLLQTAWFTQQDQLTACFMPVPTPDHPPGPCITINATFNTWGSVTDIVLQPPGSSTFPEVDTGMVQYTDSLLETIMMPDGSMQTVTQTSQDSGTFIIAILI